MVFFGGEGVRGHCPIPMGSLNSAMPSSRGSVVWAPVYI